MSPKQRPILVTLLALPLACGPTPAPPPQATPPLGDAAGATDSIRIPSRARRNLGITFAQVELRPVAQTLRIPGAFELQPLARQEYHMPVRGRVRLLVDQYQRVTAGTPLFRYQSPVWPELLHEIILGEQAIETAQVEIRIGDAKLEEARRALAQVRTRIDSLAGAAFRRAELDQEAAQLEASLPRLEAEIERVRTQLNNARSTRRHALHRAATVSGISEAELLQPVDSPEADGAGVPTYLTIDWIEVRADSDGVVEALHATDGAFVEPSTRVLSTMDPHRVRFRALALQADLPRLALDGDVRIVPPSAPQEPIAQGVGAELIVGLEAHPKERTIPLIATPRPDEVRASAWIRPGQSAFLELTMESSAGPALAVPRSAIVQDGLRHILFRRDPADPDRVLVVEADMGASDGRWVVLESGVMRGDEVVMAGAYELKLAAQDTGQDSSTGHVHADGTRHGDH